MLFNSLSFFIFLPTVFMLYWFVFKGKLKAQNGLILIASYVFYAWWDWRFLSLIIFSTLLDYTLGLALGKSTSKQRSKTLLWTSLIVNLGFLGVFKYYNFFVDSWVEAFAGLGINMEVSTLSIILPVGISFYTFQTLSYTIDVYREQLKPTQSLLNFAAYVAFFPQLVAGPIERATRLLPQFSKQRVFNYKVATSGVYLIIWGLFKKVVIADNCAFFVNQIFDQTQAYSSLELALGAVLFAFQIYGDFSGYSDIAIGTARLFGFQLMTNFAFPYFSRDIAEFWRRWHISLSTWFRDYVYIPLGGSRVRKTLQVRNVMIIFLVSGFWHGANWTFLVWGALHGLFFLPLLLFNLNRKYLSEDALRIRHLLKIGLTFGIVCLAWVFFRADTITEAIQFIVQVFEFNSTSLNFFINSSKYILFSAIIGFSVLLMLYFEFRAFRKHRVEVHLQPYSAAFIIACIVVMGAFKNQADFIYFQF
ncbi:MBOAT family O-acyltransferase [Psychroflexus salinarum]|uniref:MBOAT family O-acyltransferase n=1 Tax=Psychroflexus salinarum TaxID=546024 RepID=A0ABW3GRR6_9FLAO